MRPTPRAQEHNNSRSRAIDCGRSANWLWSRSVKSGRGWIFAYWVITVITAMIGVVSAAISALRQSDPEWFEKNIPLFVPYIHILQSYAWAWFGFIAVAAPALKAVQNRILEPKIWRSIKGILDTYQALAFKDRADSGAPHEHRVTLFRKINWRITWPWKKPFCARLVAVERSGHMRRNTSVSFLLPDAGDDAQGIAGRTFVERRPVQVENLPDISNFNSANIQNNIEEYANRTFVPIEWIHKEKPEGRSYLGIPVEIHGELWGVLVFDSREPKEIPLDDFGDVSLKLLNLLGKLLQEK